MTEMYHRMSDYLKNIFLGIRFPFRRNSSNDDATINDGQDYACD